MHTLLKKCDGIQQCPYGEDELDCGGGGFYDDYEEDDNYPNYPVYSYDSYDQHGEVEDEEGNPWYESQDGWN